MRRRWSVPRGLADSQLERGVIPVGGCDRDDVVRDLRRDGDGFHRFPGRENVLRRADRGHSVEQRFRFPEPEPRHVRFSSLVRIAEGKADHISVKAGLRAGGMSPSPQPGYPWRAQRTVPPSDSSPRPP